MNRSWYICMYSMTVRMWASLKRVPRDLACRIMRLQEFQYRILWLESHCNPPDVLSRPTAQPVVSCSFPRFVEKRIVNARGEVVDHNFRKNRCQAMADAVSPVEDVKLVVNKKVDAAARASILDAILRPMERMTIDSNEAIGTSVQAARCSSITCGTVGLDDKAIDQGVVDERFDIPVENAVGANSPFLNFDNFRLVRVQQLQSDDDDITLIKGFISGQIPKPDKTEVLLSSNSVRHYFRNESSFRLTDQGILTRLWLMKDVSVNDLIVVGKSKYEEFVKDAHFNPQSDTRHFGKRKTFANVNKIIFGISCREVTAGIVPSCASCCLNNHVRTKALRVCL